MNNRTMQTSDIIARLAKEQNIPIHQATAAVNQTIAALSGLLTEGNSVTVRGLGKFTVHFKEAEAKVNQLTKETMQMPPRTRVTFSPGDGLAHAASEHFRKTLEAAGVSAT